MASSGTQPGPGILSSPGLLAAGAAGLASAILALAAFRGLPLGALLFWIAPLPLFTAGFGFGPGAATGAALLAALLVAVSGSLPAMAVYVVLFAAPTVLLLALALRGGPMQGGAPLAVFGLWPVAVLLVAAWWLSDGVGLAAFMQDAVRFGLARMELPAAEDAVALIARVQAAGIAAGLSLALIGNGAAARSLLRRLGLAMPAMPAAASVRLPVWYLALPSLAAALVLLLPQEQELVPLSALLILLLPVFLLGVIGVHARLAGVAARLPMLVGFYALLVIFLQLMGPAVTALGLYDQILRRQAPRQS